MNKWYMHSKESVRENETHRRLLDFYMQTYHRILVKQLDLVIVNNKEEFGK